MELRSTNGAAYHIVTAFGQDVEHAIRDWSNNVAEGLIMQHLAEQMRMFFSSTKSAEQIQIKLQASLRMWVYNHTGKQIAFDIRAEIQGNYHVNFTIVVPASIELIDPMLYTAPADCEHTIECKLHAALMPMHANIIDWMTSQLPTYVTQWMALRDLHVSQQSARDDWEPPTPFPTGINDFLTMNLDRHIRQKMGYGPAAVYTGAKGITRSPGVLKLETEIQRRTVAGISSYTLILHVTPTNG